MNIRLRYGKEMRYSKIHEGVSGRLAPMLLQVVEMVREKCPVE